MIFVITGTGKYPFDRLAMEMDRLAKNNTLNEDIFIQLGSCHYKPAYCRWVPYMSFGEMCESIDNSKIVITHAGAGSTLLCIQMGYIPIIVPRLKKYGEIMDEHQISFAKRFETTGMVNVAYEVGDILGICLKSSKSASPTKLNTSQHTLIEFLSASINN